MQNLALDNKNQILEDLRLSLTEKQLKAINDFMFDGESMKIYRELGDMYRSWLVDPNRLKITTPEGVGRENVDNAFMIEEIVALVNGLYE